MRVLICGGRDFFDLHSIFTVIRGLGEHVTIIEGEARGADRTACTTAEGLGLKVEKYPADWDQYGRAAGPIRNKQMLVEGKPDVVWAFTEKPLAESKGTANMVKQAKAAGLPVYVVEKVS